MSFEQLAPGLAIQSVPKKLTLQGSISLFVNPLCVRDLHMWEFNEIVVRFENRITFGVRPRVSFRDYTTSAKMNLNIKTFILFFTFSAMNVHNLFFFTKSGFPFSAISEHAEYCDRFLWESVHSNKIRST